MSCLVLSSSLPSCHDRLCDVYVKHRKVLKCVSVNYACLACYFAMRLRALFFIFIHLHIASRLGTLDEPREGCDVESNPKMVFGGSIPKMEGLSKC